MSRDFGVEIPAAMEPDPERLKRAERAVERAVASLWCREARRDWTSPWRTFYACLAAQLELRVEWQPAVRILWPDGSVTEAGRRAWTDGRRIVFNAATLDPDTPWDTLGVVLHELEHVARLHLARLGDRDLLLWNIATDLVINEDLVRELDAAPRGALRQQALVWKPNARPAAAADPADPCAWIRDPYFEIDAEEHVYDRLLSLRSRAPDFDHFLHAVCGRRGKSSHAWLEKPEQFPSHDSVWIEAFRRFLAGPARDHERQDAAAEFHPDLVPLPHRNQDLNTLMEILRSAALTANSLKPGSVPGYVMERLNLVLRDAPPWTRALRRWLERVSGEKRSWTRLHRRSLALPYPSPSRRKDPAMVGLVVDTSGSMRRPILADVLSEVRAAAHSLGLGLMVWQADAAVYGPFIYSRPSEFPLDYRLWGGGGTMMSDAARAVAGQGLPLTLWVTDGRWGDTPRLESGHHIAILAGAGCLPEGVQFDEVIRL